MLSNLSAGSWTIVSSDLGLTKTEQFLHADFDVYKKQNGGAQFVIPTNIFCLNTLEQCFGKMVIMHKDTKGANNFSVVVPLDMINLECLGTSPFWVHH